MKKEQRSNRIIARGEHSGHCHVVVGEAEVSRNEKGEILIEVTGKASIRHLLESAWLAGEEVWTKEHEDIPLEKGTYRYVPQQEFDPAEKKIREVRD
jgi:hypothetical protein